MFSRFFAAHNLDAIDRLKVILVIEQNSINDVHKLLYGAHPYHSVDIVRDAIVNERNELRLRNLGRCTVQYQDVYCISEIKIEAEIKAV